MRAKELRSEITLQNYLKENRGKKIAYNKETYDREGSRIHQFRGDLSSGNQVLTAGSLLNHSSWIRPNSLCKPLTG